MMFHSNHSGRSYHLEKKCLLHRQQLEGTRQMEKNGVNLLEYFSTKYMINGVNLLSTFYIFSTKYMMMNVYLRNGKMHL